MATRYKVTKEQVEKLVENFVMEAASPEATKHIKGSEGGTMVEKRPNSGGAPSKKDWGRNDAKKHSSEAKKHVTGSEGGDMVEERPNTPNASEVKPGVKGDKVTQSKDAKKHVNGKTSVDENIEEGKVGQFLGTDKKGLFHKKLDRMKNNGFKIHPKAKMSDEEMVAQAEQDGFKGKLREFPRHRAYAYTPSKDVNLGSATGQGRVGGTAG
jgi:hypothetical protein